MSTLSLAKKGYVSSSKCTKHIKAKYFFIRHFHKTGKLDLQYCPTKNMWADILTQPLQGTKFCLIWAFLMNCPIDYYEDPQLTPVSTPTLAPSPARVPQIHRTILQPSPEPTDIPFPMKH
jgi:hypothetical protein